MNFNPADNYDGLLKQARAMVRLIKSMEAERRIYSQKDRSISEKRLLDLEAALASEKEMNAILTEELEECQKL